MSPEGLRPIETAERSSSEAKGTKRLLDFTKRAPAVSETKVSARGEGAVGRWGMGRPTAELATTFTLL
jgi:hypothetical protein